MLLNNFYTYYRYYYNIFLLIHKYFIVLKMVQLYLLAEYQPEWVQARKESEEYIQEQWNGVK